MKLRRHMALEQTRIQEHTEVVVKAKDRLLIFTSLTKLKFHTPNFKFIRLCWLSLPRLLSRWVYTVTLVCVSYRVKADFTHIY